MDTESKPSTRRSPSTSTKMLGDVEALVDVVNRAVEGEYPDEIAVSGDHAAAGHLADGLQTLLSDLANTKESLEERESQLTALSKSQAVIEFEPDGTILTANDNFLGAVGYSLDEIQGSHHRMFVDPTYATSNEYRQFWLELGRGDFKADEYQRFRKDGTAVWIQASYNPVFDGDGKVVKVVKYASDITAAKLQSADYEGQLGAISRSQAVIEFEVDGTIITANENFLNAVGYTLDEVKGNHHRIFVDPQYAATPEYRDLWNDLAAGKFKSGEFQRFRRDGSAIWIQASYNPILDPNGKPYKVVKYASDITEAKMKASNHEGQINAINKAQAVIEFELDGTIARANDNFLNAVGYTLDEIKGRHHRIFVAEDYAKSDAYSYFWQELGKGQFKSGEYQRFGKGGKEIWIQASYNPIFDPNGEVYKVVKYAMDITPSKEMARQIAEAQEAEAEKAESDRQRVQHILDKVQRVGQGDATARIEDNQDDLIGSLANGLNEFFEEKQSTDERIALQADNERRKAAETQEKVDMVLGLVNSVADGNFEIDFPDLGADPVGKVATALAKAVTSIRSALIEVRDVSGTIATASTEMSSASEEIARGAQNQAARLEETASSLEEITTTVKQNSENAQEARALANGSRDVATEGGNVVGDAVTAMREINESSKKIADIITTIDEIAFQTNLLALNAAVEAARAGEQGRGFAVVAAEVRNLAQRSASSAKEIKSLINDSNSKVEKGTQLVNKSGETLGEIVDSVKRVTDIVSEIAAASQEQLSAIEQVTAAVTQIDQVTQASASQTEELAGTSGSVLNHVNQLEKRVSSFRLGGALTGGYQAPPMTPSMPAPAPPAPVSPPPVSFESSQDDFMEF